MTLFVFTNHFPATSQTEAIIKNKDQTQSAMQNARLHK